MLGPKAKTNFAYEEGAAHFDHLPLDMALLSAPVMPPMLADQAMVGVIAVLFVFST